MTECMIGSHVTGGGAEWLTAAAANSALVRGWNSRGAKVSGSGRLRYDGVVVISDVSVSPIIELDPLLNR